MDTEERLKIEALSTIVRHQAARIEVNGRQYGEHLFDPVTPELKELTKIIEEKGWIEEYSQ